MCCAVLRQATLVGAYNRQVVGLQDGGCVALDWWKGACSRLQHGSTETPIVLILHGLTGAPHPQQAYILYVAKNALVTVSSPPENLPCSTLFIAANILDCE